MRKIQNYLLVIFAAALFAPLGFVSTVTAQTIVADANLDSYRQEYEDYLVGMQEVLGNINKSAMQEKLRESGGDASGLRASAHESAMNIKAENLVAIHDLFVKFPNWRKDLEIAKQGFRPEFAQQIAKARKSIKKSGRDIAATEFLIPDFCPDASAVPSINDVAALQSLMFIAEGVMELLPTDTWTFLARAIPVGLYTAAQEALLAAQTLRDLDDQCTSASKDDIQEMITTAKEEINKAGSENTDTIVEKVEKAQTEITKNDNENKDTIVKNDNDNKDAIVKNDNENTAALTKLINESTARIINNDNDNKNELRNMILRTQIEADLSSTDGAVIVALYETPSNICLPSLNDKGLAQIGALSNPVQCGLLDLVRSIVRDTIASVGTGTNAQAFFAQGDANRAAGKFKAAYASYRQAYKAAAK